jgi:hypothetical protein
MRRRGFPTLLGVAVVAAVTLPFSVGSASAAAPSAGWSISSLAEPTNFSAGDTQDGVEELAVSATGGTYELQPNNSGVPTALIMWDASAEEVQKALEALPVVGIGDVSVVGGPGGSSPYTVTWDGALSGNPPPGGLLVRENQLTGGKGTVSQRSVQQAEAKDRYTLTVANVGSRASEGEVTITDKLPPGVLPLKAVVEEPRTGHKNECTLTTPVTCAYSEPVPAGGELLVTIGVAVPSASLRGSLISEATVAGGGGSGASASESTAVNVGPAPFGIDRFAFEASGLAGVPDAQAGDHPYGVTASIDLNTVLTGQQDVYQVTQDVQDVKDVAVDLPPGFVGEPLLAERCPMIDLTDSKGSVGGGNYRTSCPPASRVGTIHLVWAGGSRVEGHPVYNVVPAHGYPAELGFNAALSQPIFLYASVVPSASGYKLRVATPGVLRALGVEGISMTVFGDPAEQDGTGGSAAFATNPSDCSDVPLSAGSEVSSWEGVAATAEATAYPALTGCDLLQGAAAFDPSIQVAPETTQADTPSGYEFDVQLPQAPSVFGALATPALRDATVTLPAGVSISPSLASGPHALEGCTPAQIDLLGTEPGEGHPGGNGSPYDDGLTHASPGHCPAASIVGTVEATSPLLSEPLAGHVYLAAPTCGGEGQAACTEADAADGSLYGLYVEVAGSGVIVKFPGSVSVDPATGRATASFRNLIQTPVSDIRLRLDGGPRAPLANPQTCGPAGTTSDLAPWSAPFTPDATPSSAFNVDWDGQGGACPGAMPFSPAFTAGTIAPAAGAFSPFTATFSRQDREQDLAGVSVTMPPGLLGILKSVALCGEPQAAQGACSAASLIGHTTASAGAGAEPLSETGQVFLTGPYKGAPFGLSVVVPAVAGPFNLGNIVVRAAIRVNPNTAQITVSSDPLPQIIDGVPLRIKTVNVTIDRPGFIFNPTNCDEQQVTGTIGAAQGASAGVSSPFAVGGCAGLVFKPLFTVSTQARTSKKNGASLTVKGTFPSGEANVRSVAVTLPKQLPARLTTIQQACPEATFAANPAGCPAGSDIGVGTASTPILAGPVAGPAYLVSHGGAAFPNVVVILQGEGVTIDLVGSIDIKHSVTSSTFATVPDAPIGSFQLTLPEGPHSGLAAVLRAKAKGSMCGTSLSMPFTITGQNGSVLKETPKITVTGCPKAKKAKGKHTLGGHGARRAQDKKAKR